MTPSIKVLKLTNGEEIIGVVYDGMDQAEEGGSTTISHLFFVRGAMKVVSEYSKEKQAHALFLQDWFPSVEDDILPIDKQNVLTLGNAMPELEQHYCDVMLLTGEIAEDEDDKKKNEYKKMLKKHNFDDDDMQ
jgi:hypothetical protein